MTANPSLPPLPQKFPAAEITWPIVAYALVRELPYMTMSACGAAVAITLILHGSSTAVEQLTAVIGPQVVAALSRSKPPEALHLGLGALALLVMRKKFMG